MNAFYTVWCVVLVVMSGGSQPMVPDANVSEDNVTMVNVTSSTTESNTPPPVTHSNPEPVSCFTPKGLAGVCEERKYCDYQTVAIDLTLYMPRRYFKTCIAQRPDQIVLCCPLEYLAPRVDEPQYDAESNFDDDDDDF